MTRARIGSWILGVVVLAFLVSQSTLAIGPAFVVLHGGALQRPIVLRPAIGSLMFMWAGGNWYEHQAEGTLPPGLEGRRYLDYDVFWGRFEPEELKPEAASQHGRLYLPATDQAAAVVLTSPNMDGGPGATRAEARPVPRELKGFVSGRALTPSETAALVGAGVPMN
ncbi:MAG: hypothetical protein ABI051_13145 [Vicinamibacterales bacterium]